MGTYGHEGGYAFNADQRGGHHEKAADHIGPIDGLNFMSLNMTDKQLQTITRAILKVGGGSPEESLANICNQYLGAMEWQEIGMP